MRPVIALWEQSRVRPHSNHRKVRRNHRHAIRPKTTRPGTAVSPRHMSLNRSADSRRCKTLSRSKLCHRQKTEYIFGVAKQLSRTGAPDSKLAKQHWKSVDSVAGAQRQIVERYRTSICGDSPGTLKEHNRIDMQRFQSFTGKDSFAREKTRGNKPINDPTQYVSRVRSKVKSSIKQANYNSWSENFKASVNTRASNAEDDERVEAELKHKCTPEDLLARGGLTNFISNQGHRRPTKHYYRRFRFHYESADIPFNLSAGRKLRHIIWKAPSEVAHNRIAEHQDQWNSRDVVAKNESLIIHGEESQGRKPTKAVQDVGSDEGWVLLTCCFAEKSQECVLSSENDVISLVSSCMKLQPDALGIRGIHIGRNLKRQFAHVLFQHRADALKMLRLHKSSLGRQVGRFSRVKGRILRRAGHKSETAFGFYIAS